MNFQIRVPLNTSPEQYARLCELRVVFAQVCNQLAPHVQQSRVWNRVALHHLHYRALREQFPALGSQMVCNAIYAVSKMARLIYQHPQSPYNPVSRPGGNLPLLRFADLQADTGLLAHARDVARELWQRHPQAARAHVARWLGGRAEYLKA